MNKEMQDLVQRDVGTEGEEDTEPMPASKHSAEEEPILAEASIMAQPFPIKTVLYHPFSPFLKRME